MEINHSASLNISKAGPVPISDVKKCCPDYSTFWLVQSHAEPSSRGCGWRKWPRKQWVLFGCELRIQRCMKSLGGLLENIYFWRLCESMMSESLGAKAMFETSLMYWN